MVFPVVMYGCESWTVKKAEPKNWCFWTVVLEKTLESPLDCKEIQPVHPKGNQSWIFIGRTDAEVETPILWPCDAKNWLIEKDPDAGKDWRQEEKGTTEDEMVAYSCWGLGEAALWDPPLPSQRQKQLISTNVLRVVIRKDTMNSPLKRKYMKRGQFR